LHLGFSTKVHAIVDLKELPLHIELTPGQQHEATMAQALIEHAQGRACIAEDGAQLSSYHSLCLCLAVAQRSGLIRSSSA
jgi:hypothetical protein